MKFACERCGRSYALADELRGKTFKMKCKACGHLIVVKASAAEAPARAAGAGGGAEPTPSPVTIPDAPLGDEPPAREPVVPEVNPFVARPVSAAGLESLAAGTQLGGVAAGPPGPAAGEHIDLALDGQKGQPEPAEARGRERPPPLPPRERPGLLDPFADWKPLGEIDEHPLAEPVEPPQLHLTPEPTPLPAAAPGRPHPGRPWARLPQEGLNLKALAVIGGVAVAAVAVLLFVYVGRGGKPPAQSVPVAAQPIPAAPVPASPPAPEEPLPAAEPGPPGPEVPRRLAEPGQRTPRPVKVAEGPRPEPGPAPGPGSPPRPAPADAAVPAATPGAAGARPEAAAPSAAGAAGAQPKAAAQPPRQVAKVASANKRAFEQCIAEAATRDPGLDLGGRQVTLMLTVSPDGTVTAASIDDADLDETDLGSCIRSAARMMTFPAFEGYPMEVEVPLTLGR